MEEDHPDVPLYIGALDERLNQHAYILPGLEMRRPYFRHKINKGGQDDVG